MGQNFSELFSVENDDSLKNDSEHLESSTEIEPKKNSNRSFPKKQLKSRRIKQIVGKTRKRATFEQDY